MIPSIVLWLAMMGQGDTKKIVNAYAECPPDNWCPVMTLNMPSKPAEHVIEIRTKRRKTGRTMACYTIEDQLYGKLAGCKNIPTPMYCPESATCETLYRTVKTLYIDGQKVGVIREVEEK